MRVSLIICTVPYRISLLSHSLFSVISQSFYPHEVIVVDKGFGEFVKENLPQKLFTVFNLRIVESDEFGLSKARNKSVEVSSGDILIFMDDDVIITEPNLFRKIRELFKSDKELGVYGVQVKSLLCNSVKLPDKFSWIYGCTDNNATRPVGAFFAVRRICFSVVGSFNERLGRKGEFLLQVKRLNCFTEFKRQWV